jgi:hypothetical protein
VERLFHPSRVLRTAALPLLVASQAALAGPRVEFRDWELGHPHVSGSWLTSVAWGAPGCVAVGWYGEILFSPDGSDWSRVKSPWQSSAAGQSAYLWDLCYGNGVFVAVGGSHDRGGILRSADGRVWTECAVTLDRDFRGVAFGDGLFAAVAGSAVFTSADGIVWQRRADAPGITKIAHGAGKWVGSAGGGVFRYTTDFETWQAASQGFPGPSPSLQITGIDHANGKFIAVGGWNTGSGSGTSVVKWSADGLHWSDGGFDEDDRPSGVFQGCAGAGGRFAMVGTRSSGGAGHVAFSSSDAATWTRAGSPPVLQTIEGSLQDVAGADGRPFVAVASTGQIWKSADASAWEVVAPVPREEVRKLVHADGRFVAVGGTRGYRHTSAIFSSADGLAWSSFLPERDKILSDVIHAEGLWVAGGDDGGIFSSPDSLVWTDRSLAGNFDDLRLLAHGAGRFIALPSNRERVYHSDDGVTWQVAEGVPVAGVNAVGFINGKFIAVGDGGLVLSSPDGLAWTRHPFDAADDLLSVCHGKGRYVAGALDHTATSDDGITWQWHPIEQAPRGISYRDGWFMSDDFRVSRDGVTWIAAGNDFPRFYRMTSMVFTADGFVGASGLELWKGKLTLPGLEGLTVFHGSGVEIKSTDGIEYRLLESPGLDGPWEPGVWRLGDGDYLRWPVDFSAPRNFWKVETR